MNALIAGAVHPVVGVAAAAAVIALAVATGDRLSAWLAEKRVSLTLADSTKYRLQL